MEAELGRPVIYTLVNGRVEGFYKDFTLIGGIVEREVEVGMKNGSIRGSHVDEGIARR